MKIRLTENQYKRLLKEDDKDFLDGMVNFKNIGNKIDSYIAKLYLILLRDKDIKPNAGTFKDIAKKIQVLIGYTEAESMLLAYNFAKMYDEIVSASKTNDWESLLGKPLEFYGKFTYPITVRHTGYVSGYSSGSAESYATSYEDFRKRFENGDVEAIDNGGDIDYDNRDIDFEADWDYTYDSLIDDEFDDDNIEIDID